MIFRIKPHLKQSNKKWEMFRRSVYFSSIIMFTASSYFIYKYNVIDRFEFSKNTSEIQQVWEKSETKEDESKTFDDLLKINPEIKGWIKIDGTVVDYPVLQSSKEDSSFYLYRNYKKEKDKNGSIFIHSDIAPLEKNTKNIVLHGHNMRNGTMFASVAKYSDINFLKSAPIIKFDTIFEPGTWKIFAVIQTNSDPKHGPLFFDYLNPYFASKHDFMKLIYDLKIRSVIEIPVEVSEYDKILTLSTCSYEMNGFRTVVCARKIRDGEDKLVDVSKIRKNPNPMMPNGWYEARKMKIPKFDTYDEFKKKNARN